MKTDDGIYQYLTNQKERRARSVLNFWVWMILAILSLVGAALVWEYDMRCLSAPFLFAWLLFTGVGFSVLYGLQLIREEEEKEEERWRKMTNQE